MWNRLASNSYSIFFPITSIVLPCLVIFILYMAIFVYVSRSKSRVIKHLTTDRRIKQQVVTLKIAKGLFFSYVIFTACWLPYGLVVMTDFGDKLPRTAHMYSMLIAHLNSSLNPVVYAISNPLFQKGYKNFFSLVFCFKNPLNKHFHADRTSKMHSVS